MSGRSNFYRGQSRFGRSDSGAAALRACLVNSRMIYLHLALMNCVGTGSPASRYHSWTHISTAFGVTPKIVKKEIEKFKDDGNDSFPEVLISMRKLT